MGDEWKIGDAIEVEAWASNGNGWGDSEAVRVWRPATVCGLSPLSVAFSDSSRLALHGGIGRRRPVRA